MFRIIFIFLCLFCISCTTKHKIQTIEIEKPKLNINNPEPLKLTEVKFIIINKDNAIDVLNKLEENGEEAVLFSMEGRFYKSLASNIDKIKNYILLQKKIINLYKNYYEEKEER